MKYAAIILFAFLSTAIALTAAANPIAVSTDENWCQIANDAAPGDILELAGGDHDNSCHLRAAGTADQPIVIRSADPGNPARLAYHGTGANTVEIRSESQYLTIENLHFPGTAGPHAIRFHEPRNITIRGNHFERTGGVTLSANFSDTHPQGLQILDNTIFDVDTTAIYFGCHGGADDCQATDVLIEGNTIYGVDSPGVGYGIQIKADSNAVIRDNAIFDIKGPGIMVYGSHDPDLPPSAIDGNLVITSRTSGGILIGGGPAIVTNNIVADGSTYGIHVYQHNAGAPLREVVVAHNTLIDNQGNAIHAAGWSEEAGNILVNNAIAPGDHAAIGGNPNGLVENNITCDPPSECFFAPNDSPFSVTPLAMGPLADAAPTYDAPWYPEVDFLGHSREDQNFAGALNVADDDGHPWLEFGQSRPERDGDGDPDDDDDGESGDDEDSEDDGESEDDGDGDDQSATPSQDGDEPAGCGCASASHGPDTTAIVALLVLVGFLTIARRKSPIY